MPCKDLKKNGTSISKPFPSSFSSVSISFNFRPFWTRFWNLPTLTTKWGPTLCYGQQQGYHLTVRRCLFFEVLELSVPDDLDFLKMLQVTLWFFLTIFWSKILRNESAQILDLLISEKMLFEHTPVSNFLLNVLRIFDFFRSKVWIRIIDYQNSVLEHSEIDVDFLLVERRILIGLILGGP